MAQRDSVLAGNRTNHWATSHLQGADCFGDRVVFAVRRYLRRETRRAVRRPVRRATLRDPNISFLLVVVNTGRHQRAAAAVSMSCSSLASSADISPISMRSSGLMKPSLMRKPPARAIASRSGTAQ
jgi:hypothetical protein